MRESNQKLIVVLDMHRNGMNTITHAIQTMGVDHGCYPEIELKQAHV
ncbi:MAG: hypothetical protein PHF31_02230 [Methylobacter sp.]|nr:hypothetical protein [Methylobacter sp.]